MLTHKQIQLLELIHTRMERDGVAPSFEEMKDALDLRSKSGIHRLITALEERGFIRRLAHRARAIEVLKLPDAMSGPKSGKVVTLDPAAPSRGKTNGQAVDTEVFSIQVMGRIAAGTPIEAINHAVRGISVPGSMIDSRSAFYALEVQGDSMIDLGINDGDIVVIREQDTAAEGDIVVALIEGQEATLKRFHRRNGMIALEAANPAYETRYLNDDQVEVQGRLVGLIRSY